MIKQIEDVELIKKIDQEIFLEKAYQISDYEAMKKSDIYIYYLYIENDDVIGFSILTKIENEYEILKIGILRIYQSKGYGSIFLKEILKKGITNDIFLLEVDESNKKAISLYKKIGFEHLFTRKAYYENNHDALIYRLIMS